QRFPKDLAIERPGLHVEAPIVAEEIGIVEPEGLVVHEQLDDLAVGYLADGLPSLGKAIGILSVNDRPRFIESINKRGVFRLRTTFLRAPANAEIAVAEGEH